MNFEFTQQQLEDRAFYAQFAQQEILPYLRQMDEEEATPPCVLDAMRTPRILGIPLSTEYGGLGRDFVTATICMEELSKVSPATAGIINVSTEIVGMGLYNYGTEEQKRKYLTRIASGEAIGAFALTEPGAGSDSAGVQTTAELVGEEYVLNGTKMFITNAEISDIFLIAAKTDVGDDSRKITMFIVEKGTPGFSIGSHEHKMGIRSSSTCELVFDNCRIPKENLLGQLGKGLKIALGGLDGGRVMIATQGLGIAQGCIDHTVAFLKEHAAETNYLLNEQNTKFTLAKLQTRVDAARLLCYRAAAKWDSGARFSQEAAMAKYYATDLANEVARECIQLMGYQGLSQSYQLESFFRDAKITEIYEGTNEIQLLVLSGLLNYKI